MIKFEDFHIGTIFYYVVDDDPMRIFPHKIIDIEKFIKSIIVTTKVNLDTTDEYSYACEYSDYYNFESFFLNREEAEKYLLIAQLKAM